MTTTRIGMCNECGHDIQYKDTLNHLPCWRCRICHTVMEIIMNNHPEISGGGWMGHLKPKGHPHVELMAQYAEDAKTNERPQDLWEFTLDSGKTWHAFHDRGPEWYSACQYRRKPQPIVRWGIVRKLSGEFYTTCSTQEKAQYMSNPGDKIIKLCGAIDS